MFHPLWILLLSACVPDAPAPASKDTPAADVETVAAHVTSVPRLVRLTGSIKANASSEVTANFAGQVTQVLVERGTVVHKGDPLVRLDGRLQALGAEQTRAILLAIRKQSGENTVEVVDAVKARLEEVQAGLPTGYSLEIVRDGSGFIRTSVATVKEHLVLGAVCASLVVLLFLGSFRSAIIAALAIPVSIIGTFALMWWQGFTLNMITLLALALAVGIVIDDAIVVLENIFRFVEQKGYKPFPAAIAATRDIGLAVLATTFSLMAVFLPVAFMSGMAGRFMRGFGVTMAFAVGVSLLVAFSLTPALAARIVPHRAAGSGERARTLLERGVDRFYQPVERFYLVILQWVMRRRWVVVLGSLLALLSIVPLSLLVPKGFMPENDEAQFEVSLRAPEGTSREGTALLAERVARGIRELPGVLLTCATIGASSDASGNEASVYVRLIDPEDREQSAREVMNVAREQVLSKQPKELRVEVPETAGPGNGAEYLLSGPDLEQLGLFSQRIVDRLRENPAVVDANTSYIQGKPEVVATIDRARAADLGVSVSSLASTLKLFVGGVEVGSYAEDGEEYPIRMRAEARYRDDAAGLDLVTVPSSRLGAVPLRDVVELEASTGPASVSRSNRQRQVTVSANAALGHAQSEVQAAIEETVADLKLPSGYAVVPSGFTQEMGRTFTAFGVAFGLSFIFMYLVLAAQFESWIHPLLIMTTLPLTIPFALLSLLLFDGTLNTITALGLFVLFGIVKKNAILQVDHTNKLRQEGRPLLDAILEANKDRLRPILMTTMAFVAGMLPLAFSEGVGAGQSQAIASVVIGGQTLSLLLTLLAIPVGYSLIEDLLTWFRKRRTVSLVDRGEAEIAEL